ncbi:hypothetical protein [Amycolatopsis sp. GM8]|uniref:hypothetical protein n=1 Tax=Amycolatopsis sp. GM8 TaxID=2896530 RepID=UPI001F35EAFC|nr:hypothetical protein [Amycolatopsis sp. GM8]
MRTVRTVVDGRGTIRLEALPLPFAGPAATDEDARRAGELSKAAIEVLPFARPADLPRPAADSRFLIFVVAGGLDLEASDTRARLHPGDVLLTGTGPDALCCISTPPGTRLLGIRVSDSWAPGGTVPPATEPTGGPREPLLEEMFVRDGIAHFRRFDRLFADAPATQALNGLSFLVFSPGHAGTWHTDTNINLVCVTSGALELEVGGDSAVRRFGPGDVCLVQDQHGQGHILRAHRETRILAARLPGLHRWNTTRQGEQ